MSIREVVVDTETTGLSFKDGDRIIEIACVELVNHVQTGNSLQFYCATEKTISKGAAEVHGLTNDFLKNHPSFKKQSKQFLDFIKNDTLIIHNAEFDMGFINNELKIIKNEPISNNFVDTVQLARKKLNTRIANLDHLCKRFSVDLSSRKLHGALLDCQLLAEVYLELVGGKQTSFELSQISKKRVTESEKIMTKKQDLIKINPTNEEKDSHKRLVKNIKNALWNKLDY